MTDQPTPKTYLIKIEGQEIPVGPEIGASDDTVRAALAGFFPEAANAMITRTEKDGVVSINVVKRAGTKGASGEVFDPLARLLACPGGMNPAVELYRSIAGIPLADLDPEELLKLNSRIECAIETGQAQLDRIAASRSRLQNARPVPSPVLPQGF